MLLESISNSDTRLFTDYNYESKLKASCPKRYMGFKQNKFDLLQNLSLATGHWMFWYGCFAREPP